MPNFVENFRFTRICREIVDVAIYGLYPESFCDENIAIRKVFVFFLTLEQPYLLFVIVCTPVRIEAWKKAKKCVYLQRKLSCHEKRFSSICYLELPNWKLYLELGYGLFGIFNPKTSHNNRQCFNILWINFSKCSLSGFSCGKFSTGKSGRQRHK